MTTELLKKIVHKQFPKAKVVYDNANSFFKLMTDEHTVYTRSESENGAWDQMAEMILNETYK